MAIPSAGELGNPSISTADFQTKIEDLRDAVATLIAELDAAELTIGNNSTAIATKLSKVTVANSTAVYSGTNDYVSSGSITGGIITGTYIVAMDNQIYNNREYVVLHIPPASLSGGDEAAAQSLTYWDQLNSDARVCTLRASSAAIYTEEIKIDNTGASEQTTSNRRTGEIRNIWRL